MLGDAVKMYAQEFGGFQLGRLPDHQIEQRMCCSKGCGRGGKIQMPVPGGFRVLCGMHAVLLHMLFLGCLGDPTPVAEVRMYAERLGVNWDTVLKQEPRHPTSPESFVCLRCSGGLNKMPHVPGEPKFMGELYTHNCGAYGGN